MGSSTVLTDKNIPLNDSSCYLIMYCPSPKKYLDKVEKYIDIRMSAVDFKDHIQEYSLNKDEVTKVGPGCYYEPATDTKVRVKNDYVDYEIDDYNKLYISWATNLLPEEINLENAHLKRVNEIHYCGSISRNGITESFSNFQPFMNECQKNNVNFIHNNPWTNPLPSKEVISRVQKSLLGVDIRGKEHIKQKLITCRVFKNISYGQLGLTNSEEIYNEMDGNCVFNPDTTQLFHDGIKNKEDYDLIKKGMMYVKENHTFFNRIESILKIVNNE